MFALAGGIVIFVAQQIHKEAQMETALSAARTFSESVASFRSFYINEVAPLDAEIDMLSQPSPHSRLADLTDPYSDLLNLAENSNFSPTTGRYRVFSKFPWPMRDQGGARSVGEQHLLDELTAKRADEAIYVDERNDGQVLYLGRPIVMQEACVRCHNQHPRSPKTNWKVGDVRGVQSVEVKLSTPALFGFVDIGLFSGLGWLFAVLFLCILAVVVIMARGARQWQVSKTAGEILQDIAESLLVLDTNNRIVAANQTTEETFGYSQNNLLGRHAGDLLTNLPDEGARSTEGVGVRQDGEHFPCLLSVSVRRDRPSLERILTIRDISEQSRLAGELRITQNMNAVGRLTAGIAHGFNNILATVLGNNEVLKGRLQHYRDSVNGELQAIDRAVDRGVQITDALVNFARQDSHHATVFDINAAVASIEPLARAAVHSEIAERLEYASTALLVCANRQRLENALLALIMNAIDAMPDGGELRVSVSATASGDSHENGVALCVHDTGKGICSADLERVWQPYFSSADVSEGRGLGLSTVYGFAQQAGGHVSLDSAEGEGTTVTLYLPLHEPT